MFTSELTTCEVCQVCQVICREQGSGSAPFCSET